MTFHPRQTTLGAFAAGDLDRRTAGRLVRHLQRCQRCRTVVSELRAVLAAAADACDAGVPSGTWAGIEYRLRAQENVFLPAGDNRPAPRTRRAAARLAVAGVAVLAISAAILLRFPAGVSAGSSELRFEPADPRPGDLVAVEYSAAGNLSGPVLHLRARLRTAESPAASWMVPHVTLARLTRSGDVYRGSFRLPDSVVLAVFAVEAPDASAAEAWGERWDLLVHDHTGIPSRDALIQRVLDNDDKDGARVRETLALLERHYPDDPEVLVNALVRERPATRTEAQDSLTEHYLARLRDVHGRVSQAPMEPRAMASMSDLGDLLGEKEIADHWRARILRDAPTSAAAVREHIEMIVEEYGTDAATLLPPLDALWQDLGAPAEGRADLANTGFRMAIAARDPAAVHRWGLRLEHAERGLPQRAVPRALLTHAVAEASLRADALERSRQTVRELLAHDDRFRLLGRTRVQQDVEDRRIAGIFLGLHARVLLAAGDTTAALDTLRRSADTFWNAENFRLAADVHSARGQSREAGELLARVVVDPGVAAAAVDSLASLGRRLLGADSWDSALAAARVTLREQWMRQADPRPLRGRVETEDADGNSRPWPSGTPTVVVFWSANCPAAVTQLPVIARLAGQLQQRGVPMLLVTPDDPADALPVLGSYAATLDVRFDDGRSAHRAFNEWGYPTFYVLDAAGRIQFRNYSAADVLIQAAVLASPMESYSPTAVR